MADRPAWYNTSTLKSKAFDCGHCGKGVGSNQGYFTKPSEFIIYICQLCNKPTFFNGQEQVPGKHFGNTVTNLPADINVAYRESRNCMTVQAYTGAAMLCRKLLMNIAVSQGAKTNQSFKHYVEYLANEGFVPVNGKAWVDQIKEKGNEANHEIHPTKEEDARDLLSFTEMLLKLTFEYPAKAKAK